jgi:hypothetical protein
MFIEMCAFMGIYAVSIGYPLNNVAGQPIDPCSGVLQTLCYFTLTRILKTQTLRPQSRDKKMKYAILISGILVT